MAKSTAEKVSLPFQERANKACSGWWGFCGFEKHFSGFGFFLLPGIFPARPTTTNANRWVALGAIIKKVITMSEFPRLSNREWDVLKLLLQGKSNKLIASSLGISNRTVEFHLKNIYAKFQVSSRIELILKLGKATGGAEIQKLGHSTVASTGEIAENKDRLNLRMSWAKSFIGKEIDMKKLLTSKHVLVGAMTTLFTGAMWVSALLYSQSLLPSEIKAWVAPLIIVWVIIGLTIGLVGKRYGTTLQRVFFSALLGAGLSPFTIIPLMMFVVLPIGKLVEWSGMIDPATMPNDVATNLTMIAMITIWLFVGTFIGIMLLFLTFKKPEQASTQAQVLEKSL